MATFFHTVRDRDGIHTFWTTLGDFRRIRSGNPGAPRFLIEAETIPAAEAIAAALWTGGAFYSTTRGKGGDAVGVVTGIASESVTLADGAADQSLIPGVAAVPLTARQLAQERQRREARRGAAGLPCGGLWDETAMNQGSLF
jgi:hypothetical protein